MSRSRGRHEAHADVNAAQNILARGLHPTKGITAGLVAHQVIPPTTAADVQYSMKRRTAPDMTRARYTRVRCLAGTPNASGLLLQGRGPAPDVEVRPAQTPARTIPHRVTDRTSSRHTKVVRKTVNHRLGSEKAEIDQGRLAPIPGGGARARHLAPPPPWLGRTICAHRPTAQKAAFMLR